MLGNRASLPAALIRDERQCHAKAAPTERPFRQGRATTSAGMAMGLERRRLARMLTGVEPRRIFKDAVAGTLALLPTCSRRCGTDQKARSGTLAGSYAVVFAPRRVGTKYLVLEAGKSRST
jgi:hypothetical protein